MSAGRRLPRMASVLVTLAVGGLAGATVLYQVTGAAHSTGSPYLGISVDAIGVTAIFILGVQMMSGYRILRPPNGRFQPLHRRIAWTVAAVVAVHGGMAVWHTVAEGLDPQVVRLDTVGLAAAALVGLQLVSGYARSRTRHRLASAAHPFLGLAIGSVAAAHAALGILHTAF